jgi:hypothetical protein
LLCQVQELLVRPNTFSQYTLRNEGQEVKLEQAAPKVRSISFVIYLFHVHVEVRTFYTKLIYNNFIGSKKKKKGDR